MKNVIKFLTFFLLFTLAATDFLFAQEKRHNNPDIALCNNTKERISLSEIQNLIKDSCLSILTTKGQYLKGKIEKFAIIFAPINISKVQQIVVGKGYKLNQNMLDQFAKVESGDIIIITSIFIKTENGLKKQKDRAYNVL